MGRPRMMPGTYGDAKIVKNDDGTYSSRVYYRRTDGTGGRKLVSAATKKALERKIPQVMAELIAEPGPAGAPGLIANAAGGVMTFEKLVAAWLKLEELKVAQSVKARGTHAEDLRNINAHLMPTFGTMPLADIGPRAVHTFYTALAEKNAPLARNVKGALKKVLDHAIAMEWMSGPNPAGVVKSLRRQRQEIFAPGVDELRTLREAVIAYVNDAERPGPKPSPLLIDLMDVMISTGFRIGEAIGLRVEDVYEERGELYAEVRGAVKEKGGPKIWEPVAKTADSLRRVLLDKHTASILLARQEAAEAAKTVYLFHTKTGRVNGPQDAHRALRRVREAAGIPGDYVPHAFRRSITTEVAERGGIEAAAQFAGHRRSRITESNYAKRNKDMPDMREVTNKRWETISGKTTENPSPN